jgi:hypothetical protein
MAELRKAQVLLEPDEYDRLEEIATSRGVSVPELIRTTVRERYPAAEQTRRQLVEEICRMNLPISEDWETIEEEIADAHNAGFP